ncbi:MAG: NAD-dependent epimerase/dehydratase family protein [Desulfobacteraceae bacterium]|nr:NAD-dependent epimerase/dehydratase family protein [Desulfobacteraceae bacterium]
MMGFWKGQQVMVTGGCGFAGSHLLETLLQQGARVRVVDDLSRSTPRNLAHIVEDIEFVQGDLGDLGLCEQACEDVDIVLHLAAKIRGIAYNTKHQGDMFYSNASINLNIMEAARKKNVERFLYVSTVGVYPGDCRIPTPEEDGFLADPEGSSYGYGWAKRMGEIQAKCYADEYGMKIAIIRPWNVYGPRDDFNLATAPVVPSLILKVLEQDEIEVWGTGEQTRTFTYVEDFVQGAMLAVERYSEPDPLNIGSNEEVSTKDLLTMIIKLTGRDIKVSFDVTKPSGAPRRCPNISKAKKVVGYEPRFSTEEGLKRTIEWYLNNKNK